VNEDYIIVFPVFLCFYVYICINLYIFVYISKFRKHKLKYKYIHTLYFSNSLYSVHDVCVYLHKLHHDTLVVACRRIAALSLM
jgi:hypothetical protein